MPNNWWANNWWAANWWNQAWFNGPIVVKIKPFGVLSKQPVPAATLAKPVTPLAVLQVCIGDPFATLAKQAGPAGSLVKQDIPEGDVEQQL